VGYLFFNAHCASVLIPNFLKTIAAGQKPVKDDCTKLAPTKTVSQTKFGLTQWVSANDSNTMNPAKRKIAISTDIINSSSFLC